MSSTSPSRSPRTGLPTVESFSIALADFDQALHAEHPTRWVEAQLLSRLKSPVRLLRWAIVKVEQDETGRRFWCEGAYIRRERQARQKPE